jgi:phage/conjugal plasmid C-4 type zinc finger TraR family protein
VADDIDMAQEAYERFLNTALAGRLNHQPATESLTHCTECEEEIPEARRKASPGCTRCVKCQESFELLSHWRN